MTASAERSHYQVLGVSPSAGIDEIRRAHRQLARVLHPDRLVDANGAERSLAERRMREVNAAWTVLSDPAARRRYDRSLQAERLSPGAGAGAGAGATGTAPSGAVPTDDDEWSFDRELDPDEPPLPMWQYWLLRRGPIVAALLVAGVLFVVTAYAGGGGDGSTRTTAAAADCVRVIEGRRAVPTSCEGRNNGRIVTVVDAALDCPAGTRYVLIEERFTCVDGDAGQPTDGG